MNVRRVRKEIGDIFFTFVWTLGDWAYYSRLTLSDWTDVLLAGASNRIDAALKRIGQFVLDKFVHDWLWSHHLKEHNEEFEVCPRCPKHIRTLSRIGWWLVGDD